MTITTDYTEETSSEHRQAYGQFFTHPRVARFMVDWVLESGAKELYDPAYGLGAFRPARKDVEFSASEIDPLVLRHSGGRQSQLPFEVRNEDYFSAWGRRHGNIVCNPPYMRFQKFLDRKRVFADFAEHLGLRLSGYTNTASAFLLKSLAELKPGGRLAYIMPLEFLNTGYGEIVKRRLLQDRHLRAVIQLECEREIFPDATTSVGILLYDMKVVHEGVSFYSSANIESLEAFATLEPTRFVPFEQLDPRAKWLPFLQSERLEYHESLMVPLTHYGRFCRGIATGANEFFVLTSSRMGSLGLKRSDVSRCVCKSAQIANPVFSDREFRALKKNDAPVFLFSPGEEPSDAARSYIEFGESQSFDARFLTKHRNPWYKTESREPAPLLLGVFSRGGYKIILNHSSALNLTCYHGFRPNDCGRTNLERLFLYFESRTGREIVSRAMRKYGGELDKFEPNDLNSCLVPSEEFLATIRDRDVAVGIAALEKSARLPQRIEKLFAKLAIKEDELLTSSTMPVS